MAIFKPYYIQIPNGNALKDSKIRIIGDNEKESDDLNIEERAQIIANINKKLSVAEAQHSAGVSGIYHEELMGKIRKMIDERNL